MQEFNEGDFKVIKLMAIRSNQRYSLIKMYYAVETAYAV